MLTYQIIYQTLQDVRVYYTNEAAKPEYNKNSRQVEKFTRLATIAKLFENDVKNKRGTIPNGKIPISLSLEKLVNKLKKPKSTITRYLHTFKASFDRYLAIRFGPSWIGLVFELQDYNLQGRVSYR